MLQLCRAGQTFHTSNDPSVQGSHARGKGKDAISCLQAATLTMRISPQGPPLVRCAFPTDRPPLKPITTNTGPMPVARGKMRFPAWRPPLILCEVPQTLGAATRKVRISHRQAATQTYHYQHRQARPLANLGGRHNPPTDNRRSSETQYSPKQSTSTTTGCITQSQAGTTVETQAGHGTRRPDATPHTHHTTDSRTLYSVTGTLTRTLRQHHLQQVGQQNPNAPKGSRNRYPPEVPIQGNECPPATI
jgi:hypothetical protein